MRGESTSSWVSRVLIRLTLATLQALLHETLAKLFKAQPTDPLAFIIEELKSEKLLRDQVASGGATDPIRDEVNIKASTAAALPNAIGPSTVAVSPSSYEVQAISASPDVTGPSPEEGDPSHYVTHSLPDASGPSPTVSSLSPDDTGPSPDVAIPSPEIKTSQAPSTCHPPIDDPSQNAPAADAPSEDARSGEPEAAEELAAAPAAVEGSAT